MPARRSPLAWPAIVILWLAVLLAGLYLAARESGLLARLETRQSASLQAEVERLNGEITARRAALAALGCTNLPPVAGLARPAAIPPALTAPAVATPAPTATPGGNAAPTPEPAKAPEEPKAAAPAPEAASPKPSAAAEAAPAPAASHLNQAELIKRIERGTVLVLTQRDGGSGFFVTPTMVVTNRHVVATQSDGRVIVTSKSLGRVIVGRVVAASPVGTVGAPDFAVIEVPPTASAEPLPMSPSAGKLLEVIAAGYPGLAIDRDIGFQKLLHGDATAAPDLNINDGKISAIQDSPLGTREILHSASVLTGNSGGPLVDACGRVVGVNTFIAVDQRQSGRISYALSARDLLRFLAQEKVNVTSVDAPCQ
ncbi:MAG: serine protease [Alphaproteobacteria bacterium]